VKVLTVTKELHDDREAHEEREGRVFQCFFAILAIFVGLAM
jgi:hypothetical protein